MKNILYHIIDFDKDNNFHKIRFFFIKDLGFIFLAFNINFHKYPQKIFFSISTYFNTFKEYLDIHITLTKDILKKKICLEKNFFISPVNNIKKTLYAYLEIKWMLKYSYNYHKLFSIISFTFSYCKIFDVQTLIGNIKIIRNLGSNNKKTIT